MTGNAPHCTCPAVWMSVLPPPPCPAHSWHFTPSVTIPVTTTQQFTPIAPSISDADIERIAKRVAEFLRTDESAKIDAFIAPNPPPVYDQVFADGVKWLDEDGA